MPSWTTAYVGNGGESQDDMAECITSIQASSVTCDSTAAGIETGARCVKFPLATDASQALLRVGSGEALTVYSGTLKLSASPSTATGLLSASTQGGARYVRINTDGTLALFNDSGTQLTPWTNAAISTSTTTRFQIMISKRGTSSTSHRQVTFWVGGKWQFTCLMDATAVLNPPASPCWGEYLPSSGTMNRGADLYADNLVARGIAAPSGTGTDAVDPCHTKYPKIVMQGGASLPPAADGSQVAWVTSDGGATDYTRVDEFPNDGDTTYIAPNGVNDLKENYQYTASNPFTSSHTIHHVYQRYVARLVTGGKNSFYPYYRDASGNEYLASETAYTTSYSGGAAPMLKPSSGVNDWVYTDFGLSGGESTLEFGMKTLPAGFTISCRVTCVPGPEVYYSDATEDVEVGVLPWRVAAAIAA